MRVTSSESGDNLGRSEKRLIASLVLKTNVRSNKNKKARFAITNVGMKNLSKNIKKFENFPYKGYVRKRPKHEPTESYFYLARQLAKCMMIFYALNWNIDTVRTEITGTQQIPITHICSMDKSKSKELLVDKTYRRYVLQTRTNKKGLLLINFLRRRANQK